MMRDVVERPMTGGTGAMIKEEQTVSTSDTPVKTDKGLVSK